MIAIGTQESEKTHLPFLGFQEEAISREPHEWPTLVRIMDYTADAGPPKHEEKSKPLREGISEFRTKGGLRLVWLSFFAGKLQEQELTDQYLPRSKHCFE